MSSKKPIHDLRILAWDIERIPAAGYTWGIHDVNIGINQLIEHGETVSFAARWVGDPKRDAVFYSTYHNGKHEMLNALWDLHNEADALLSWNGAGFDTKHVNTEFIIAGMTPPSPSREIDLMKAAKKKFRFLSNKLDYVAQRLGVGHKIVHEGFPLWLKVMENDPKAWESFRRYNLQDVHLLIELYEKLLPWIDGHPNVLLHGGNGCPRCGSAKVQSRGYRTTSVGQYQRFHCQACGAWSSSGKSTDRVDIRPL